ncbi:hypothetical protein [Streptomyces sp. MJM8645]|uniref:hypothetical protein n=1 Tax=Streptomycetaceae TaxID=2062 RepID=UPI000AA32513|nr:hypothetical protein [Streptomyces sp. MJM8645]
MRSKLFGNFRYPTAPLRADSGQADDYLLNQALRQLRPKRVILTVDVAHLVLQVQDPDAGFYRWDPVAELPLRGAA